MDLLSLVTRGLDKTQRRLLGIHEFSRDPDCIYRLSIKAADRDTTLPDGTAFHRGEPVGILHIWGEHVPEIPPSGINLAWAAKTARVFRHSNELLAEHVLNDESLQSIPVFGHDAFPIHSRTNVHILERMGFDVLESLPARRLRQRICMRIIRLWTWLLRRSFNQESTRGIRPCDLQFRSIWMSRRRLLERFGTRPTPQPRGGDTDGARDAAGAL
jgi:hypothetical protein